MILTDALCVDCGELISSERLRVVPGAVRCLECQIQAEIAPPGPIERPCPKCGSKLVWRLHREGTADYFAGCSTFPACRFVDRVTV